MNTKNDDLVIINRDGVEVHPRAILFEAIMQFSTSELLILDRTQQVDSFHDRGILDPKEEHTIYHEKLSIMGAWTHIILYRTSKDKKVGGSYTPARYALLDSHRLHYMKMSIDQLVDWLINRTGNHEALIAAVSDIGDAIKRQQDAPRMQS